MDLGETEVIEVQYVEFHDHALSDEEICDSDEKLWASGGGCDIVLRETFELSVTGQDERGDRRIAVGDPLYFHWDTGVIDGAPKNPIMIGYANGIVEPGETKSIHVLIDKSPTYAEPCHTTFLCDCIEWDIQGPLTVRFGDEELETDGAFEAFGVWMNG